MITPFCYFVSKLIKIRHLKWHRMQFTNTCNCAAG